MASSSDESARGAEALFLRFPDPRSLFRVRAERFGWLASQQRGMSDYLAFMARLAEAQRSAVERVPAEAWRVAASRAGCSESGLPPLSIHQGLPSSAWREALQILIGGLRGNGAQVAQVVESIEGVSSGILESWAESVLKADYRGVDPGVTALIAAALQVCWTAATDSLGAARLGPTPLGNLCPVCGSSPVASVIVSGGTAHGLRYLVCPLCSAQWNLPRIRCVHCGSGKGVAYYRIEGTDGAVTAEGCDDCKTYLKILNREKDPRLDPFADDLSTLPLDIMMAESGFSRFGANPFLIPGE